MKGTAGGVAEGTVGVVAERSTLVDYPLGLRGVDKWLWFVEAHQQGA